MTDEPRPDPLRLPEEVAHRLMARAIELDTTLATSVPVAELRDTAAQAGISPAAFDAALGEVRAALARGDVGGSLTVPAPPRRGWLSRTIGRLRGEPEALPARTTWESVLTNAVAFLAFWGILVLLVQLTRATGAEWQVRKAIDALAPALGAIVAHRLRAGFAKFTLAGFAVAIGAEVMMDLVFGRPVVQGGGAHFALLAAGLVGVGLGAVLFGRRTDAPSATSTSTGEAEPVAAPTPPPAPPLDARRRLFRLRHA